MREPVVKQALGKDWDRLPKVLQKNFDLNPGQNCQVVLSGTMYEVKHSLAAKLFVYLGQLCGALVPWQGRDIPITIQIWTCDKDERFMYWRRVHYFPGKPEFVFASRMEYLEGNEIIERVRFNLGMRMRVTLEGATLKLRTVCYQWDILGLRIRIPNWLLLGTGEIIEREISPERFEMIFTITHPLMGRTFSYCGKFDIAQAQE